MGAMASDDDVVTYAVIDENNNVQKEHFELEDAQEYVANDVRDLRIVPLNNGIGEIEDPLEIEVDEEINPAGMDIDGFYE